MLSVADIFKIGIGPSSSHTVGPMRIARRFLSEAEAGKHLASTSAVKVDLHGSLALTGVGHGTVKAVVLGLLGFEPETTDPDAAEKAFVKVTDTKQLTLPERRRYFIRRETRILRCVEISSQQCIRTKCGWRW